MTSISLFTCLMICSSPFDEPVIPIVMRENLASRDWDTTRESILKPRLANTWLMRMSAPALLFTKMDRVWSVLSLLLFSCGVSVVMMLAM